MKRIPDHCHDSVVAIGHKNENGDFVPSATGFIFGHVTDDNEIKGNINLGLYLVTNWHVICDEKEISFRINDRKGSSNVIFDINLYTKAGHRFFEKHPSSDLAVILLNHNPWTNKEASRGVILSEEIISSKQQFIDLGVEETDGIYLLGYPLGLIDQDRNFPFYRVGIISKIKNFLSDSANEIIIDCQVYPGNSGGPVFLEPLVNENEGTALHPKGKKISYLLGVISSYIPYVETAVSTQTGRTRIEFQENSGLAIVIPAYYILEAINNLIAYRESLGVITIKLPFPNN